VGGVSTAVSPRRRSEHARCFIGAAGGLNDMNWDTIQGQWKQLSSNVKERWAKLTDEDLAKASAKKDELVGAIQHRYGVLRDEAEKQVDEWMKKMPGHKPS
jgi:uncharacterized protein YjbJ (UPF0337 family)